MKKLVGEIILYFSGLVVVSFVAFLALSLNGWFSETKEIDEVWIGNSFLCRKKKLCFF